MTAHPARYSRELMPLLAELVGDYDKVLDCMAGTGERLAEYIPQAVGIEIEREWAEMSPTKRVLVGDATQMPYADGTFDAGVVSPCYANRFKDHHNNKDLCKKCKGSGKLPVTVAGRKSAGRIRCDLCRGSGISPRRSYKHDLGRMPHQKSAATLSFDWKYKALHIKVWTEMFRVLAWNGLFVLNVKNHIKNGQEVEVAQWHRRACEAIGFTHVKTVAIKTPGLRHGQNHKARTPHEYVMVFEARK